MFYLLVFCSVIGLRQVFSTRMRSQQQLTSRRRNVKQGFGDAQTPTKGGKEGVTGCREQSWWVRQFLDKTKIARSTDFQSRRNMFSNK